MITKTSRSGGATSSNGRSDNVFDPRVDSRICYFAFQYCAGMCPTPGTPNAGAPIRFAISCSSAFIANRYTNPAPVARATI